MIKIVTGNKKQFWHILELQKVEPRVIQELWKKRKKEEKENNET